VILLDDALRAAGVCTIQTTHTHIVQFTW